MDDRRVGRIGRALRMRLGWRQEDAGARVGISQSKVSRFERGRLESMTIGSVRRLLGAYDAELVLLVRWRGGDVDRLLDARHAALGEAMTRLLEREGWEVRPEVTFAVFGERGSIDLLAWHAQTRTLLVIELKTELVSFEETVRRHDAKARLAASIARERFGWVPSRVSRLLVLPDERTPRRHVERLSALFTSAYPARTQAVRAWLRLPVGACDGIVFLADGPSGNSRRPPPSAKRVRRGRDHRAGGDN